jgi:hypothetical protein
VSDLFNFAWNWWVVPAVILFIEYIIVMKVFYRYKSHPVVRFVIGPVFLIQDWWVNLIYTTLFLDPPGHTFEVVTGRMKRYKQTYNYGDYDKYTFIHKFRLNVAHWVCRRLNRYDPEEHC